MTNNNSEDDDEEDFFVDDVNRADDDDGTNSLFWKSNSQKAFSEEDNDVDTALPLDGGGDGSTTFVVGMEVVGDVVVADNGTAADIQSAAVAAPFAIGGTPCPAT